MALLNKRVDMSDGSKCGQVVVVVVLDANETRHAHWRIGCSSPGS